MSRKFKVGMLLAGVMLATFAVTALAAPPLRVHIEVPETILINADPFTASGPAVDHGVLCPTGLVEDIDFRIYNPRARRIRRLWVLKEFTCGDGSGTFNISMRVRLDLTTNETTANWKFVGGTGDYVNLRGNGKLVGIPIDPGVSILDIYDGKIR